MRVASYARYSSDNQRRESIEDQERKGDKLAGDRLGIPITLRFRDQAISGWNPARSDYQRMLQAAHRKEFQVLVLDDLSRLGRDPDERGQVIRRLEFNGIRILSCDGYDSTLPQQQRAITRSARGMIDSIYSIDLAEKTHRGLAGQALKGFSAGGRAYGYRHVPITDDTQLDEYGRPRILAARRELDPAQAEAVRMIFQWFVNGVPFSRDYHDVFFKTLAERRGAVYSNKSMRTVANEMNRRAMCSPRGGKWRVSAIRAILTNPIYTGRVIWNRSKWERNPDTGKRRRVERPEGEWIVREDESLRIVPQDLWDRAQARLNRTRKFPGRPPRYLFSGILRCDVCGGPYVKVDYYRYGCATHKNGGPEACRNGMTVAIRDTDRTLVDEIRRRKALTSDEALALFRRETAALLRADKQDDAAPRAQARLTALEREIGNMVGAIRAGAYSDSLKAALAAAEAEKDTLLCERKAADAMEALPDFLPRAADVFREMMANLEGVLTKDSEDAREHLRALLGEEIRLVPQPEARALEARLPEGQVYRLALKMAAGAELDNVGSGGRIWNYLTVLLPASGRLK